MNDELQQRLRKELETEQDAVITELREYGADPESDRVRPIAGVDENFADSAAATAERGETFALIEKARVRLADVRRALARMDEGEYGVCELCGQPIAEARLEARPLSVRCVECASKS